jgi:hypothetical protein
MKIIIAGTRTFSDREFLFEKMDSLTSQLKEVIVVSGHAGRVYYQNPTSVVGGKTATIKMRTDKIITGADLLGEEWAFERRHPYVVFHADWDRHGKAAGPIRNEEMAKVAQAAALFWDGQSPGTKNMIQLAKKYKLDLRIFKY